MAAKVLVIGATNGRFIEAFAKITALHAKNNFSLSLLLGDLFSDPSQTTSEETENIKRLLHGEIRVPLPIYFGLGQHSLPVPVREKINSSGEVCENLIFLGKRTILNTSDGMRIVALGGRLDAGLVTGEVGGVEGETLPFYLDKDAKGLKGANYVDLLLTYEWPEGVGNRSALAPPGLKGTGVIAELAAALRPRYHFAAGGEVFWEREPYQNGVRSSDGGSDTKITRFLSVADWGNEKKAKALYAFSINTNDTNIARPASTTACPYPEGGGKKRPRQDSNGGASFFWGDHTSGEHERGDRGGKRGRGGRGAREARPPPGPESCFFCLSYPQLEKHLIVSIGNEAYVTTAKGPLTNSTTNPSTLPFSSHVLIIPLTHTPTIAAIDDEDSRKSTIEEMTNYRLATEQMLKSRNCGAVTFEVSRANGVHSHWQLIPVPVDKLAAVEEAFKNEAEADRIGEFEKRGVDADSEGDYFRVWISGMDGSLVVSLKEGEYFDLQFGRKVLAKVMGLKSVHWRDCAQTFEQEVKDANDFKEAFKPFDFSL
ncbi:CwfJ C-terminus 1-domain-containing protein-like protein [Tuber brumale]|nr:CwfJ C-terminus 1-domain-containing protein-like protein [Tuber brumale]